MAIKAEQIEQASGLTRSKYAPKGIAVEDIYALKLANPTLSLSQAGKILGCGHANIIDHLNRNGTSWDEIGPGLKRYKENRADILCLRGKNLLLNLTPEKQSEMTGLQLATAYGILYDKERLERGQSTANVAYNDLTRSLADIEAEIARLEGHPGGSDGQIGQESKPR